MSLHFFRVSSRPPTAKTGGVFFCFKKTFLCLYPPLLKGILSPSNYKMERFQHFQKPRKKGSNARVAKIKVLWFCVFKSATLESFCTH